MMATINGQQAVAFSNTCVRPAADRLAQFYYLASALSSRWTALGGGQGAISVMQPEFIAAANLAVALYEQAWHTEKSWFLLGSTALIPNTADQIADGATGSVPVITGAMAVSVMARITEFLNWLLSAAGSFSDVTRASVAFYNTALAPSQYGPTTLSVADAGNFVNRCNEFLANYQGSTNANLNAVLAVAVNP